MHTTILLYPRATSRPYTPIPSCTRPYSYTLVQPHGHTPIPSCTRPYSYTLVHTAILLYPRHGHTPIPRAHDHTPIPSCTRPYSYTLVHTPILLYPCNLVAILLYPRAHGYGFTLIIESHHLSAHPLKVVYNVMVKDILLYS